MYKEILGIEIVELSLPADFVAKWWAFRRTTTSAYDTYFQRCEMIVAQVAAAAVFPNDSYARWAFPFVERVACEVAAVHRGPAAVALLPIANVVTHYEQIQF